MYARYLPDLCGIVSRYRVQSIIQCRADFWDFLFSFSVSAFRTPGAAPQRNTRCVSVPVCVCVRIHTYTHIHTRTRARAHTHTRTHIHTHTHSDNEIRRRASGGREERVGVWGSKDTVDSSKVRMPLKNVSKGCLYRMARYIAVSNIPHEIYCCVYLTRYIAVYTSTGILLYRMSLKNVSKGCLYRMARYIEMYCCVSLYYYFTTVYFFTTVPLKNVSKGCLYRMARYIEIYCCVYLTRYIAVYTSRDILLCIPHEIYRGIYLRDILLCIPHEIYCSIGCLVPGIEQIIYKVKNLSFLYRSWE